MKFKHKYRLKPILAAIVVTTGLFFINTATGSDLDLIPEPERNAVQTLFHSMGKPLNDQKIWIEGSSYTWDGYEDGILRIRKPSGKTKKIQFFKNVVLLNKDHHVVFVAINDAPFSDVRLLKPLKYLRSFRFNDTKVNSLLRFAEPVH